MKVLGYQEAESRLLDFFHVSLKYFTAQSVFLALGMCAYMYLADSSRSISTE